MKDKMAAVSRDEIEHFNVYQDDLLPASLLMSHVRQSGC
jgi:hypothetical protein